MTVLRGIAWDHRRCWGPLQNDPAIEWSLRSLFSFGEGELNEIVRNNDLIIYDHPFVGAVADRGLMRDLRPFLTPDQVAMFERNAVGQSFRSYQFDGGLYALPIDAAAMTAAWRADLMAVLDAEPPTTLAEVFALARAAKRSGKWVGWAAKPTDLMCSYVSIGASLGAEPGQGEGPFMSEDVSAAAVALLRELSAVSHPGSPTWNPIELFDHMSRQDDIVYAPFAFNYVTYTTIGDKSLTFGSVPAAMAAHKARGLLGGAGIGVSAFSETPHAAFAQAMRLVEPGYQASDYVRGGGQPGMLSAWRSPACDEITNGFFSSCLAAMDAAFLRPTIPGFVPFFHEATHQITRAVTGQITGEGFWQWLTATYDGLRAQNARRPAATTA